MSSESKQVDEPEETRALTEASSSKAVSSTNESEPSRSSPDKTITKHTSTTGKSKSSGIDLNDGRLKAILDKNPAWKDEIRNIPEEEVKDYITSKLEKMLISAAGKNAKDMGEFTFWKTQPVPKFDEEDTANIPDGSIRENDLSKVSKEPVSLALDAFEWVTMDLNDDAQMTEVYTLLSGHYVEDVQATFRFNYSAAFLNWALKSPGWHKDWHIGVRTKESKKLVAFISGIPVRLRVRDNVIDCSEINFLCVHKKLRAKRLAPVLIKEITRRCNVKEIWQAVYTVGMVLPRPVSTCRYFHRSIDWLKLYEINFSPLPPGSTKQRQIAKYALPTQTETKGLRPMELRDVEQVQSLLTKYLKRFDMAPEFTVEEVEHWFIHKEGGERVLWSYVVENPKSKKITDFFSFYILESSVLQSPKHPLLKAAYLFYYATETAFEEGDNDRKKLKARLNALIHDALIIAKKFKFDVFNALTLLDNGLFLSDQKFGAGDGLLHYYLFNWRTKHIAGGLDEQGKIDGEQQSGLGLVML